MVPDKKQQLLDSMIKLTELYDELAAQLKILAEAFNELSETTEILRSKGDIYYE